MRRLFLLLFLVLHFSLNGQTIGNKASAIEYIRQGYVEYGISELKRTANMNDLAAQYYLAASFEEGICQEKDLSAAFQMYRRAAERGLPDAMYKLFIFYKEGWGIPQNNAKSNEWLNRFEKKGGKLTLPDFVSIYNDGLKHPENYALNPSAKNPNLTGQNMMALQNSGNDNSNNTIVSGDQIVTNITIVQASPIQSVVQTSPSQPVDQQSIEQAPSRPKSDVDQDIPIATQKEENTFALIIANENYQDVAKVENALNDGEIFAEYCGKTLGIPTSNITLVKDATYNNIKREINRLSQIASAYNGKARIIFYYAGHGIPDEATKDAFLLPIDGFGTDTSTGYSLRELYSTLGSMPAQQVIVLLDACFSGTQRGDGMLASARGVAIKAKPNKIEGNMVVLSAAQGDETAYPYQEEGHGLFTYFLLKKLKESCGNVSLGDLAEYVRDNVSKKSIVVNGKSQVPSANPSASLGESWRAWTLK